MSLSDHIGDPADENDDRDVIVGPAALPAETQELYYGLPAQAIDEEWDKLSYLDKYMTVEADNVELAAENTRLQAEVLRLTAELADTDEALTEVSRALVSSGNAYYALRDRLYVWKKAAKKWHGIAKNEAVGVDHLSSDIQHIEAELAAALGQGRVTA